MAARWRGGGRSECGAVGPRSEPGPVWPPSLRFFLSPRQVPLCSVLRHSCLAHNKLGSLSRQISIWTLVTSQGLSLLLAPETERPWLRGAEVIPLPAGEGDGDLGESPQPDREAPGRAGPGALGHRTCSSSAGQHSGRTASSPAPAGFGAGGHLSSAPGRSHDCCVTEEQQGPQRLPAHSCTAGGPVAPGVLTFLLLGLLWPPLWSTAAAPSPGHPAAAWHCSAGD